jgi:hypothetical protein
MMVYRVGRFFCWAALTSVLMTAGIAAAQEGAPRKGHDPALGRWKLDLKKSRFLDSKDRITGMTRVYSTDGDMIKVWWDSHPTSGKASSHSFSAKCDGTEEPAWEGVRVRCSYKFHNYVDGELIDDSDPTHRYYSQIVATDGKTMKFIWFSDAERKRPRDLLQLDRVEETKKK